MKAPHVEWGPFQGRGPSQLPWQCRLLSSWTCTFLSRMTWVFDEHSLHGM
jgi:hypothetical protein